MVDNDEKKVFNCKGIAMKVVVAPQSFKGTMTAEQAAERIAVGIAGEVVLLPLADGGDGTLEVLLNVLRGDKHTAIAVDALGREKEAAWGYVDETRTAIIEIARICGIAELKYGEYDPCHATSYGVGQMILTALDFGAATVILALGGSATNDAGAGMAQAVGVALLDSRGREIDRGGLALANLAEVNMSQRDPRIAETEFLVACDVNNRLIGEEGATHVYARQKGATEEDVERLEKAMTRFVEVAGGDIPYGGAAGGLGAGAALFLNGRVMSGVDFVLDQTEFDSCIKDADLVVTGEGSLDAQTAYGKTPYVVGKRAKRAGKCVYAVAGRLGKGYEALLGNPFDAVYTLESWSEQVHRL